MTVTVESLKQDPRFTKCPRCWKYHAVKDNFMELCDDCCKALIEGMPETLERIASEIADIEAAIPNATDQEIAKLKKDLAELQKAQIELPTVVPQIRVAWKAQAERYRRP
jgi:Mg2+ and Co2+ transporter CorA